MTETGHRELRIQRVADDGAPLSSPADVSDLFGNAWMDHIDIVSIPLARLDPDFFDLETGCAGRFLQKAANYEVMVAIVGDVTDYISGSDAVRDFVWEANRGQRVWFVPNEAAFDARVAQLP